MTIRPELRQRSHAGLNKGEASIALCRAIFFHRQGEIRDRGFENQSFRASGLSVLTAATAIVHWNTVDLDRAVQHLRAQDVHVPDDLLVYVAPLGWEHIALTSDYVWINADPVVNFRPLRDVRLPSRPGRLSVQFRTNRAVTPSWALADMACDAKEFRSELRAMGSIPVVPSRRAPKSLSRARPTSSGTEI